MSDHLSAREKCPHRSQKLDGDVWTCKDCGATSVGRSLTATLGPVKLRRRDPDDPVRQQFEQLAESAAHLREVVATDFREHWRWWLGLYLAVVVVAAIIEWGI